MSEQNTAPADKPVSEMDKLTTLFNEEFYLRQDATSIPASKFKILDDILEQYKSSNKLEDAKAKIEDHLKEHPESIIAKYFLGMISMIQNKLDEGSIAKLKHLLELFKQNGKWGIIEYITDNLLKFGDQKTWLKFKAEALEKLNNHKELKVVLEKLVNQDRNPELAKKYAYSIINEDKPKALRLLKQAAETFARSKEFDQLDEIWATIVENSYDDILFFEKIERILAGQKERSRLVILLTPILEPFKKLEDWDKTIYFLKKILDYEPLSTKARNDLLRAYKAKYINHSLLNDFIKMSDIGNSKKPIKVCIANFERNIVFDINNFVLHRNWGVGKIISISSAEDAILVDFKEKKGHKFSLQMAISSLKPLRKDHIWVKLYESPETLNQMFTNDVPAFIKELVQSYDNKMLVADIKNEILGKFLKKTDDWTKWWNKAKTAIKSDTKIGFNPNKKDEIQYREKEITRSEEISEKFLAQSDPFKKVDVAVEALKDPQELQDALIEIKRFYYEEEISKDTNRRLTAYLFLKEAVHALGEEEVKRQISDSTASEMICSMNKTEILQYSKVLGNLSLKKRLVNLVYNSHPQGLEICMGFLWETPVKVAKNGYVFDLLIQEKKFSELNEFIHTTLSKYKENAEVFLWICKSILLKTWDYEWIKVTASELILHLFRILKPLGKIEDKGTKLKNQAYDILFGEEKKILLQAIQEGNNEYVRKLYALFKEVPYIEDSEKEGFYELINTTLPDFQWEDSSGEAEVEESTDAPPTVSDDVILVTQSGYDIRKSEYDHLLNVEMPENSRDIGTAQERGDLRENAEYKAAMEKQTQLQAQSLKLEAELKKVKIIDLANVKTNKINIGCRAKVRNLDNSEVTEYSILGPWDANTEKNIISYLSPLGKSLLGKKQNEVADFIFDGNQSKFEILEINRCE